MPSLRASVAAACLLLAALIPLAVVATILTPAKPPARPSPHGVADHRVTHHPELDQAPTVPRQLVLQLKPGLRPADVAALEQRLGVVRGRYLPQLGIDQVTVPANLDEARVKAALAREKSVTRAAPNHVYKAFDSLPNDPDLTAPVQTSHDGAVNQWGLSKIQAPTAWAAASTPAAAPIIVAVVDSGVDSTHEDLAGAVLPGFNFVDGNADTLDDHGHGTMVAGILGAVTNNGLGIAGVSGNAARILPVKVLDAEGNGSEVDVAAGIAYAADHGARVINLSLGGATYSQAVQDAVRYAWSKNAIVIAASGNAGTADPQYPAADAMALGVVATDQNDALPAFDNSGSEVGLAAPGVAILGTMPVYPVTMTSAQGYQAGYDAMSGTSAAAPFVSGVAALILAQNPSAAAAAVVATLERAADSLTPQAWDPRSGWGRLDAAQALAGTSGAAPKAAGALRGQVVDAAGSPVAGATVHASGQSTITGADGMYRLTGLPAGQAPITVDSGGATYAGPHPSVVPGADAFADVPLTTALPAPPPVVANGGFEQGAFGPWKAGGGAPTPELSTAVVNSGSASALLGTASGAELSGDSSIRQTIHVGIPAGSSKATLSFWTWTGSTDTSAFDWQEAQVQDSSGKTLASIFKGAAADAAWKQVSFDLTPYSGQDVQLYFNVHSDGKGDPTWMYVDDVQVAYS